jgi:hypothetical protein
MSFRAARGRYPSRRSKPFFQRDIVRLSKRYDAIILVSSLDQVLVGLPTALPIADVLFCARAGQTSIADAKRTMTDIAATGAHARGIVLWDAIDPVLAELRPWKKPSARRQR